MSKINNDLNQLPKDWKPLKLGEAVQVLDNLRKPINSSERQKRIAGKSEKELFPYYGATGQVGWIDSFITDGEYVLVGEDGAPFLDIFKEKAYKIKGKTWVNNHAHILKEINEVTINDFILHYLNSINYRQYVNGTTRLKLTKGSLVEIPFPTPPKPTQLAIVSKIEELFSELGKGIENLRLAQQQLKTYRQCVLKWAFEGKLIETSTAWNNKPFKECLKFSQGIQVDVELQSMTQKKDYVRFLRIIDFTQGKDEHRFIENPGDRYFINKDEVALVRYGATTGFVCSGKEGVIANNLFKVTPVDKILNRYLFYFLNSTLFQNVIAQNIKGAAMPAISFGLINDVVLPYPSIEDQRNIVQAIESRLSVADKMEESITQSLQQAEALRQSILKKAFGGRLIV